MILTVLLCLWMVAGTLRRNQDADRNEDEKTVKRKKILKLLSLIPAIAAVIAFILTEDMTLPMQMTDKWTILMLIIFIVQAIMRILTKNKKDEEDNSKNAYA
jgi:cbb3-type cytochrome oxidase subunit 3